MRKELGIWGSSGVVAVYVEGNKETTMRESAGKVCRWRTTDDKWGLWVRSARCSIGEMFDRRDGGEL